MAVNLGINIQRSPNRINQQLREAGVIGKYPKLLLDFADNYYLANGGSKTLANAVTHARSSNATMTDGYGPELVTNGGFDSDSDWTKGAGWSISGGKAANDGTINAIYLPKAIEEGKVYACTVDITFNSAGVAYWRLGNTTNLGVMSVDAKSYTQYLVGSADGDYIGIFTNTSITIDNVSVREMPVIKWGPHNLLTYSEDFSNAAWIKSNTTVTANAIVAPDGSTTADKIESTSTSNELRRDISSGTGGSMTLACWFKQGSSASAQTTLLIRNQSTGTNLLAAKLNLSTGAITYLTGSSGATATQGADGWWLFQITTDFTAGNIVRGAVGNGGYSSVSGDFSYIWGAHLYRSDLGGMVDNPERGDSYVPTTSSDKYLPRVGHHVYNGSAWVNEGVLAESEQRVNLVEHSTPDTNWTLNRVTMTENNAVLPMGLKTPLE